jgi:regulator of nonsense transcripts 1
MPTVTRLLYQNLVLFDSGQLSAHIIPESDLIEEQEQLRTMLERNEGRALGLSGAYSSTGELAMLAVADASTIIIIEFGSKKSKGNEHDERPVTPTGATDNTAAARLMLTDNLLHRSTGFLYAFDLAPLALALFQTLGLHVANAIDMQCAGSPGTRAPLATVKRAIGDLHHVYDANIRYTFSTDIITEYQDGVPSSKSTTPLAFRAWIAHYLSQLGSMEDCLAQVPPVDTFKFSDDVSHLLCLDEWQH